MCFAYSTVQSCLSILAWPGGLARHVTLVCLVVNSSRQEQGKWRSKLEWKLEVGKIIRSPRLSDRHFRKLFVAWEASTDQLGSKF